MVFILNFLLVISLHDIQMPPPRNHPQTPVVCESERSDGRTYHRCVENERACVAGGGICILVYDLPVLWLETTSKTTAARSTAPFTMY